MLKKGGKIVRVLNLALQIVLTSPLLGSPELHALAALLPRKEPTLPIGLEDVGLSPDTAWKIVHFSESHRTMCIV